MQTVLPSRTPAGHLGVDGFLRSISRRLYPYWPAGLLILTALLFQTAFRAALPLGYEVLFDRAIGGRDPELLVALLAAFLAALAISGAAGVVQDRTAAKLAAQVMNDLRWALYRKLQNLDMRSLDRSRAGGLLSRFTNDLAGIENAVSRALATLVFSSLILAASVVLLFTVEWRLAVLTLLALAAAFCGPRLLAMRAKRASYVRKGREAEVAAELQEDVTASAVIRVFGLEAERRRRFRERLGVLERETANAHFAAALVGRTATLSVFLIQLVILAAGGMLAIRGELTIGALASFVALLLNVANACSHIAATVPDLVHAAGSLQRVDEFLSLAGASQDGEARPGLVTGTAITTLPRLARELAFEDVSFRYCDRRGPDRKGAGRGGRALHRLRFRLEAGRSLAIVGASGAGKSTVVKLLLRLYDPDRGRIAFDGRDLRHGTVESLRAQVAVVPQDPVLFHASVGDNIRQGNLQASDREVETAARQAGIHDRILALPEGYDTQVGEGGSALSGGERQRIAIARALVRRPALLILDEATSSLDPLAASVIHRTLQELRHTTIISVTHRLASVTGMDRILVLEGGEAIENGTHRELVDRGGIYSALWRQQDEVSDAVPLARAS